MSRDVPRAQYHYYLTNAAGEYVNAAGAVVTRDNRVPRPAVERDSRTSRTSTPIYNPVDEVFHPGGLTNNSLTIAQNGEKTNFLTTLSQQKQDGVLRDHGAYDRTDFRINLDHRPRDDVQFSVSGYHSRSRREELDGDPFFNLTATAPDVNLLQQDPDGTKYIFQPDPQGVHPSPLYMAETQAELHSERMRTLGSVDLRYTPRAVAVGGRERQLRPHPTVTARSSSIAGSSRRIRRRAIRARCRSTIVYNSALNASGSVSLLKDFGKLTARTTARALIEKQTEQSRRRAEPTSPSAAFRDLDAALSRNSASSSERDPRGRLLLDRRPRLRQPHHSRRARSSRRAARCSDPANSGTPTIAAARRIAWRRNRGGRGSGSTNSSSAGRRAPPARGRTSPISTRPTRSARTARWRSRRWAIASSSRRRAKETEFGLDMIFDNRYSLQLSRVDVRTTDELVHIPLPGAVGFTTQWQNAGTVVGNSLEGTLEAQIYSQRVD